MAYNTLTLDLVDKASAFLKGKIRKTPLEFSPPLSKLLGADIYLKLDFFQITGSFKVRGALFRLSQLSEEEKQRGVATCSAGNHGKAIAYAAKLLGIKSFIYVPKNVDDSKYQGMLDLGATVIRSDSVGFAKTEEQALKESQEKNLTFVSAFDDYAVMAGNGGTLAQEILEDLPQAETFILPVGGGGLSGGFSFYMKEKKPNSLIIGCQHKDSAGLKLSFEQGLAVTDLPGIETVAGGIEGGIGELCFEILKSRIDDVVVASEEEIRHGFIWALQNLQYLIEPSADVTLACCLNGSLSAIKSPGVVVLSGRNVSLSTIKMILQQA
jgi:threonine dehydratase